MLLFAAAIHTIKENVKIGQYHFEKDVGAVRMRIVWFGLKVAENFYLEKCRCAVHGVMKSLHDVHGHFFSFLSDEID